MSSTRTELVAASTPVLETAPSRKNVVRPGLDVKNLTGRSGPPTTPARTKTWLVEVTSYNTDFRLASLGVR